MIYQASPFWDDDPDVRDDRVERAAELSALLMREGFFVYNPLAHSAVIVPHTRSWGGIDEGYWRRHGVSMVTRASHLVVYAQPGWSASTGVLMEREAASVCGCPQYVTNEGATPMEAAKEVAKWLTWMNAERLTTVD